jgi:hypothetical protein
MHLLALNHARGGDCRVSRGAYPGVGCFGGGQEGVGTEDDCTPGARAAAPTRGSMAGGGGKGLAWYVFFWLLAGRRTNTFLLAPTQPEMVACPHVCIQIALPHWSHNWTLAPAALWGEGPARGAWRRCVRHTQEHSRASKTADGSRARPPPTGSPRCKRACLSPLPHHAH